MATPLSSDNYPKAMIASDLGSITNCLKMELLSPTSFYIYQQEPAVPDKLAPR